MAKLRPFVLGIEGGALTSNERALFSDTPPAGIILFKRNVETPKQVSALNDDIKTITNGATKIYIDQEGGRVQRMAAPHWRQYPSANAYDELDDAAFSRAIYAHFRLIADELKAVGFDINCAPCLDLRTPQTAQFLQDRAYGGGLSRLKLAASAAKSALEAGGVLPVTKHIPGHGLARSDSHVELPSVSFERDPFGLDLPDDVQIFVETNDYHYGMVAHCLYPQIDADNPLTLSQKGVNYIREVVGYKGILLSDDLDMKALSGAQSDLARQSLGAGMDLALSCKGDFGPIKALYETDLMVSDALLARLEASYGVLAAENPLTGGEIKEFEAELGIS